MNLTKILLLAAIVAFAYECDNTAAPVSETEVVSETESEPETTTGTNTSNAITCTTEFGATDDGNVKLGGTYLSGNQFTAPASKTISQLAINLESTGLYNMALYDDNAGSPGVPLTETGSQNPSQSGWQLVDVPKVNVTAGVSYWIIVITEVGIVQMQQPTSASPNVYRLWSWTLASTGMPSNVTGWLPSSSEVKAYALSCN